jgi:hypothetical protein
MELQWMKPDLPWYVGVANWRKQHAIAAKLPLPPKYLRPFFGGLRTAHDGSLRGMTQLKWRRVTNLA